MEMALTSPLPQIEPRWISPSAEAEFRALQDAITKAFEEAKARVDALPMDAREATIEIIEDTYRRTEGARNQMASLYGGFTLPAPILVRKPAP